MSMNDLTENQKNNPVKPSIEFNEEFIIDLTNDNCKTIIRNAKQKCKILQISSNVDLSKALNDLNSSGYPNLFIFIIDCGSNENITDQNKLINEYLSKFSTSRPLLIQQTFKGNNVAKFYYKAELSTEIVNIDQQYPQDYELYEKYKSYLNLLLDRDLDSFEGKWLQKLSYIKNSSIVLRFLRTLKIEKIFFESMVLKVAENGSKADLLAIIGASFEENGSELNNEAQYYIQNKLKYDESLDKNKIEKQRSLKKSHGDDQDDPIDGKSSQSERKYLNQSILMIVVKHLNQEITDYLITYCSDLIQQLPFKHQINISTIAFNKNLDVLSDLLEISDFPFPKNFDIIDHQLNHERLQRIIADRENFFKGIIENDFKKIDEFINNNINLKLIFNQQNGTAMNFAIHLRKYKAYFRMKSFGMLAIEFNDLQNVLDNKNEFEKACTYEEQQINDTVNEALYDNNRTVFNLCSKSVIHNRRVIKEDEIKYRKHIKQWLKDIYIVEQTMLEVVATCENLKIIFDFESKFINRTAFKEEFFGLAENTVTSRIFIGAKFGDTDRTEQDIKGTLAHELCHYAMSLVYHNHFLPYYKNATDVRNKFDNIVRLIDKWSSEVPEPPKDECNETISSVFTSYEPYCFSYELIVRPVHILALYDNKPEYSTYLHLKYLSLFGFWYDIVVPEMQKSLEKNKVVIRINKTVGLTSSLLENEIEIFAPISIDQLTHNKLTIVTTNVPKLLFINIYKNLQENCGCLLDSQNLFLEPEKIDNNQVWDDLNYFEVKEVKLKVFVDCTKENLKELRSILSIPTFNFILVVSSDEQVKKILRICRKKKILPNNMEINYNWKDLKEISQIKLLETEVKFQNTSKVTLMELLSNNTTSKENDVKTNYDEFSRFIDKKLFNLLVEKQEIHINSNADDDSSISNFEPLYQKRKFLKKGVSFKNEISQEKLISIAANNNYVLISDIAGSGKSWAVKSISKIIMKQYPTRWVTYVDLKEFTKEFKQQIQNFEFTKYFIENILKPKTDFETTIFKNLYKNGRVSIIFDGFDEIAPNYAEFVANLAKLFESNEGNQLWIVTRDYFEVNLKEKLKIDSVYKLADFTEDEGINFIVASWILTDDSTGQSSNDFNARLKSSPNLIKYQKKAKKIVKHIVMSKNQSIGLAQLFSMIAEGFKKDKYNVDDLKRAKIFTKFVDKFYTRWANKGKLRKKANVKSQHYDLNFIKIHQYCALASLFSDLVDLFFPDYNKNEWSETEIIACGLMKKFGSFIHETFREFFVADFIFNALKKPNIKKEIIDVLIKILTIHKYGIIRMFLSDFIESSSTLEKIQLEMNKSVENFHNIENLSDFFTENQENLAKLVIQILKNGNYEKVHKILSENIKAVATQTKKLRMFSIFTEFLFSFIKKEDIKGMISDQNILQSMIGADLDVDIFEHFVLKIASNINPEYVKQELKLMPQGCEIGNIFNNLGTSENLCQNKVKKFFEIIQNFLSSSEIVNLMEKCTPDGQTILEILVQKTFNFTPFFDGAESYLMDQNLFQKLKNMVVKIDLNRQHILHLCAFKEGIELVTSIWVLIQNTFPNKEEIKTLVFQKDNLENNFLHIMMCQRKYDSIEFTLNKLKTILNMPDYREILRSKGRLKKNLIHVAIVWSKEVKVHQLLWKELRDSCEPNDKFLDILVEVDDDGNDVLNHAAAFATKEVFEFIEGEIAKITTRDKIRNLLLILGNGHKNVLQSAAMQNKSVELHETLWKTLHKYFNLSELIEFVKNCDIFGNNSIINVIEVNTKEVVECSWNELKKVINSNKSISENHKENVKKCEEIIKNILESNQLQKDDKEIFKFKWIKNENSEALKLFDVSEKLLIEQNLKAIKFENLQFFAADKNVENHEKLWINLVETNKTQQNLKQLLSKKDENANNFIHTLVASNTADVVEFTIQKLKDNLTDSDYQEILKSKGQFGRNLLQVAAVWPKEVETHQILWKELQKSCKSEDDFWIILKEVDVKGNDVFNLAAAFTTKEVFEFMEKMLTEIAPCYKIKKMFVNLGFAKKNLLQAAARQNKSLEFHEFLWKILHKYFNLSELLQFVKHCDVNGHNLLKTAEKCSTTEILKLIWTEVEKVLIELCANTDAVQNIQKCKVIFQKIIETKEKGNVYEFEDEIMDILNLEWIRNQNSDSVTLFDDVTQDLRNYLRIQSLNDLIPFEFDRNVSNHEILWDYLLETFSNSKDLAKLLSEKDQNGDNYIHLLIMRNTADLVDFTLKKLRKNFNNSYYHEILRSKGQFGRNLLQLAAESSKEIKTQQILWKAFQESCDSSDEFLELLSDCDKNGDNILAIAASFSTKEILKFMIEKLKQVDKQGKIKLLLTNSGYARRNLLQSATVQNESLELHETLWDILKYYFDSYELFQFVKYCDAYGENMILNSIEKDIKEIRELTWNHVREIITNIGYENNVNFKLFEEIMKMGKKFKELTEEDKAVLKLDWIECTNSVNLFENGIQLLAQNEISVKSLLDLMPFINDENIDNHKILWTHLEESLESYEKLVALLSEKDNDGDNFINLILIYNIFDVILFTLNKLKEILNDLDYQEILRSKGQYGRNLLQLAVASAKEVSIHKILWKELRDSCSSEDELLELLGEVDEERNNVFHLAAALATSAVFEHIIFELQKLKENEIKKYLASFGKGNKNLLQSVATQNKNLETNKLVWKIILEYFDAKNVLEFIEYRESLLCGTVYNNTKEIVEFTWNQIKTLITTKDEQIKYLNKKGHLGANLQQLSLTNRVKDSQVADLVHKIMQEYKIMFT